MNCPASDYKPLKVISHVTPKGISSVGQYTKMSGHRTLLSCAQSCCLRSSCHVVFFHNDSCFHITCRSMKLCEPVKRTGSKYSKSSMILVRNADLSATGDADTLFLTDYNDNPPGADEEYTESKQRREESLDSIVNDYMSDGGAGALDAERPVLSYDSGDRICTLGQSECSANEVCRKSSNRRRQGVCVCSQGWHRDERQICEPIKSVVVSGVGHRNADPILDKYAAEEDSKETTSEQQPTGSIDTDIPIGPKGSDNSSSGSTRLVVSAGRNQVIQLPKDEVTLSAFVLPASQSYKYEWQLISRPSQSEDIGNMEGANTDQIKLSRLAAGNYTFRVSVTSDGLVGASTVNVTVLPPKRLNKPPVAVIKPANSTVQLPNKDTVLDASFSTDDNNNKIVKQALVVPIGYTNTKFPSNPTLQLKDLLPGLYQLNLTVTDSDGATNSTIANVTVLKEIDYPPTANAGQDQIIFLPQNDITLMGNQSTDDKGIALWQWTRAPDDQSSGKQIAVDMDGTSTPFLHLSKLEVGVYKFVLKVTDTANQSSQAEVHVFVKPENNRPPLAVTPADMKVVLPLDKSVILDGSKSSDDTGVTKWLWEQIDGPKQLQIVKANESVANVTNKLFPGEYGFRLTVWDAKGANSSAAFKLTVIQEKNSPPVANGGGDRTVTLPVSQVVLNGSQSYDDVEIVSYEWCRTQDSLAFGDILDNSSYSPVLRLTNLIAGRYLFKLTVADNQGAQASEVVSLIVKPSPGVMDEIELILNTDIKAFTSDQMSMVLKRLELLLSDTDGQPIKVQLIKLDTTTHSRRVILVFTVINGKTNKCLPGLTVVKQLKQKLKTDSSLITPEVISLETMVCQNECSNHGSCDQYSKRCLCEAFWMEDLFRYHLGDRESNCGHY
ncbi:unnamed protein product [Oppiella nova]|uniref:PKD/Chitinase domain-containing protein n=1 Tax=Oppiella nova TaxID=334625 RepID=A0A7R9LHB7_9ACAR|nr:unnamed protein product [Oppiella nova]CAG2163622.1 unnamed protein product [Oppiella nova]